MRLFEYEPDDPDADELFEDLGPDPVSESQARSTLHGREFDREALEFLEQLGARVVATDIGVLGYHLDAEIEGANGSRYYVDGHGTPDRTDRPKAGMRRDDTMLKFGFKALRLHQLDCPHPLLLVTSHLPRPQSRSAFLLRELGDVVFDAVATVGDLGGQQRLRAYFNDDPAPTAPLPAPWRVAEEQMELFDA